MEKRVINELKKLTPLIEDDREYGGFINCHNLSYSHFKKGEEHSIELPIIPIEAREMVNQGERMFHTHPRIYDAEPSGADIYLAAICDGPTYIITADGLYELTPEVTMSIRDCRIKNKALEVDLEDVDDDCYGDIYADEAAKVFRVEIQLYKI